MGYPMTWQRIVRRNLLTDGDYGKAPIGWACDVNMNTDLSALGHQTILEVRRERLLRYEQSARMLAGDLRRLERDAQDEQNICREVARRTGMDSDIVAAVLKEFFGV